MATRKLEIEIVGDDRSLQRALGRAGKGSDSLGSRFGDLAKKGALLGGAAGLGAVVLGAKKVISSASDLNESTNAVRVVFGKASGQLLKFGKTASTIGLSMNEFNELVTPVGAGLRNAGFGADAAAKSTLALTKRAADMASVFNTSVPEALEAIQAGLRGEADPLERFGVGLSDAAVKAKGVEMGFKLVNGQLDAHAKAQARVALILEQTNKLQGDFKNTSGGLANQQRIISAEFENLSATIGMKLLPALASATTWAHEWVEKNGPAIRAELEKIGDWIGKNVIPPLVDLGKIAGSAISGFASVIRENKSTIHDFFTGLGAVVHAVSFVAIPALRFAVRYLVVEFKILIAIIRTEIAVFKEVKGWVEAVGQAFNRAKDGGISAYRGAAGALHDALHDVRSSLIWIRDTGASVFKTVWAAVEKPIHALNDAVRALGSALGKVMDAFKWLLGKAKAIGGFFGKLGGLVGDASSRVGDASSTVRRSGGGGFGVTGSAAKVGAAFGVGRQLWDEIAMGQRLGLHVTSGYRPGAHTKHGTLSDHARHAAVDMAGSANAMAQLFMALIGRGEIRQAFYDPLGSIFGGKLSSYREGGHSDHIHIAEYDRGGILPPGLTLALNRTGRNEYVQRPAAPTSSAPRILQPIVLTLDGKEFARAIIDPLRGEANLITQRSGRPAFG